MVECCGGAVKTAKRLGKSTVRQLELVIGEGKTGDVTRCGGTE